MQDTGIRKKKRRLHNVLWTWGLNPAAVRVRDVLVQRHFHLQNKASYANSADRVPWPWTGEGKDLPDRDKRFLIHLFSTHLYLNGAIQPP